MPNTASAEKAMRQSARRRVHNVLRKEAYKDALKTYRKLVVGKQLDAAQTQLPQVFKALDKAAKTNVITTNKASRLKSRAAQQMAKSTTASS